MVHLRLRVPRSFGADLFLWMIPFVGRIRQPRFRARRVPRTRMWTMHQSEASNDGSLDESSPNQRSRIHCTRYRDGWGRGGSLRPVGGSANTPNNQGQPQVSPLRNKIDAASESRPLLKVELFNEVKGVHPQMGGKSVESELPVTLCARRDPDDLTLLPTTMLATPLGTVQARVAEGANYSTAPPEMGCTHP